MAARTLSRRTVLKLGVTLLLTNALGARTARGVSAQPWLRIGTVFPARSGETPVRASINDFTGEGARMGAILASERFGDAASGHGMRLDVLLASSPNASASRRAAERLVSIEEVQALVGGVGAGQAEAIAEVAAAAGIPFLNAGTSSDMLREETCTRPVFHVEASAAMFVDVMVAFAAKERPRHWFVVHEDDEAGRDLGARAGVAIKNHDPGGAVAGSAAVAREQPVYVGELQRIGESGADTILLLIEARDQIAFLGQQEDAGIELPVLCFPDAISQTRDFMAASRQLAPRTSPSVRFAAWDVTLERHGAEALNQRFTSRWGDVLNPTAWTAYQSIAMIYESAIAAGSVDPPALVAHLTDPDTTFDVHKGVPSSFRSWDQQLRQPLYAVAVDAEAPWSRLSLASRINIANVVDTVPALPPASASDLEVVRALDAYGDGPQGRC